MPQPRYNLILICSAQLLLLCGTVAVAQDMATKQRNYHTPPNSTWPLMKDQAKFAVPSLLRSPDGQPVRDARQWYQEQRPRLVEKWKNVLGKLGPTEADRKWFGDIQKTVVYSREEKDGYLRIHLGIPLERDFLQHHLLLLPTGQGEGPFPAVIAWTETSPDYTEPEKWWGSWLAQHGYVVLTSWSFIRHYRDGLDYHQNVNEAVYERFGHWLPMAKMVYDVQREVEYLRTRPEVDGQRIGFMGFSLSAKAALYVAAFAPEIKATVAIDPHVALNGNTNYQAPWYLDWYRKFPTIKTPTYPIEELRGTVWSLLDADPLRPGFERNHHELMALCAPRSFLLIGCSMDKASAQHSDDQQSWAYFHRAKEVYRLLEIPNRLQFATTDEGHRATSPRINAAWQTFFERQLKNP